MTTYWLIGEKIAESQTIDEIHQLTPNTLSRNPTITYDQAPDSPISLKAVTKPNQTERIKFSKAASQDEEDPSFKSKDYRLRKFNQTPASSLDLSSLSGSHSSLEFTHESCKSNESTNLPQDLCYKNGTVNKGVNSDVIVSTVKVKDVVDKFNHTIADANKKTPSKTVPKSKN